jgi:hypothetical protein
MPLTFLDWRQSHHQAIGPIRPRVITTGSLSGLYVQLS